MIAQLGTAQRDAKCAEMRAQGMSWGQIGAALGIDRRSAARGAKRCLARVSEPAALAMRETETGLLMEAREHLLAAMRDPGPLVTGGREIPGTVDQDRRTRAADALKRNSESLRKLYGIDAPVKTQHEIRSETQLDIQIKGLMAQLVYQSMLQAEARPELPGRDALELESWSPET